MKRERERKRGVVNERLCSSGGSESEIVIARKIELKNNARETKIIGYHGL